MSLKVDFTPQKNAEQELLRTAGRLEILLRIASGILRAESPQAIADVALEHMERIIPSMASTVTLFQSSYSETVVLAGRNTRMKPGDIMPAAADQVEARKRGEALVISDVAALPELSPGLRGVMQMGGRSLLSVSLLAQGELIGNMTLIDDKPDAFTAEDVDITWQIGNSVAIAIHNARLLEKERKAHREAETLRGIAASMNASLGQEELLSLILTQLRRVLRYDSASMHLFQNGSLMLMAERGISPKTVGAIRNLIDLPPNMVRLIAEQQPQIIPDTEQDPEWIWFPGAEAIRCWLGVPLMVKDELIGLLMMDFSEPHFYQQTDAATALAFANHAAIAIENANLYRQNQQYTEALEARVVERTRELSALYEITAISSQHLELQDALDLIMSKISTTMDCITVTVHTLNETGSNLILAAQQGLSPPMVNYLQEVPVNNVFMDKILSRSGPYVLKEAKTDPRLSEVPINVPATFSVGTRIDAKGKILGVLGIAVTRQQPPSREDIALLTSIADQIGITIDNARLRQQSEQIAVLEERERLARDLHDSATQSLFTQTLFAAAAREHLINGQLDLVQKQLIELQETAVQTHKEMRLLLYDLRPTILKEVGLEEALRRRMQMVEFRSGIHGHIKIAIGTKVASSIEAVLFQVANEALNNVLKHSGADTVMINISTDGSQVNMSIKDNGQGFSRYDANFSAGMGMEIMRRRVQEMGGRIQFETSLDSGTAIVTCVPLESDVSNAGIT